MCLWLVKVSTKTEMQVANRDPLIESRRYISVSPSLPAKSLLVDKEEKLGQKLIFQNNCYSLRQGDSSIFEAFSYYNDRLSNLPALRKYMKGHNLWLLQSVRLWGFAADPFYGELSGISLWCSEGC